MAQGPLSGLTPLLGATNIIIVKPVVQTASHFRVAVRLRHKPLATFALRLGPWHKLPATFQAAVKPAALAVETASRFRTYLLDRAWHANPAV